jgi:maltose O-acetyltransferase
MRKSRPHASVSSEKEKMLKGLCYDPREPELAGERHRARNLLFELNHSREDERRRRLEIIRALCARSGEDVWIEPPFFCDYGSNIQLGDRVFFNFNCVVLDPAEVIIGSDVLFGPAVQVYTASHPLSAAERRTGLEFAKPIEVGAGTWIGGGAVICPGVKIGARTVIGAGSVVTRDVAAGVFAAGNPCRVVRELST